MIDDKLAKELKDAGFPQKGKGEYIEVDIGVSQLSHESIRRYYIPTLSELIEACRKIEKKFSLISIVDEHWLAVAGYEGDGGNSEQGKTKKTAVAKLWKKLNGKKK